MGMSDTTYYREHEAEDAMSVLAKWMGKNSKLQVVYHNGTDVCADIFKGIIKIPHLACASGITQEALMILRSSVYHEAGHIDDTKLAQSEYPKGALHEIWNALEDRRMETVLAGKHKGCELVFRWASNHYNKKIAEKISNGGVDAPLWESLVAMAFMVEGIRPAWTLTPKAQDYFDAAYAEFSHVSLCNNAKDCVKLAEKIYKILKGVNEEWKQKQPPPPPQQEKDQQGEQDQQGEGESKEGQDKEEKGDSQSGGGKDFDDYENEKPGQGQDDDSEESDGSDSDQENFGEGKEKKSSKKSDSKGDEKSDKGKKSDGKGDKESNDQKGDDEDGSSKGKKDGEEGDDSEAGEGVESGSEGDQDGKDGDQNSKGDKGDGVGDEGDDGDQVETDGDAEGNGAGEGNGQDGEQGQQSKDHADGKGKPGDTPYTPQNEAPKGGKGDGKDKRDLEDEMGGMSKQQAQNEDLEKFFKNMPAEDKRYISRRDLDVHMTPETTDEDKTSYRERLSQVSVTVATMTRTLEQALRSMSKCHKNPYLRYGDVDFDRLVDIAKGLSKEVFFETRNGMKLDVAVAITIDESGSMSNYYNVQLLAMAIGEALNAMHIPFEIIGSTTMYSGGDRQMVPMQGFSRVNPIIYKHYKLFTEGWASVRQRIVKSGKFNHNVDGEVVEYAAFRLMQRKEHRKVIFSLSDGEPCAGHNNDEEMGYNLKRVCNRVRKQGVECYGFGIGTSSPRAFYSKDFFVALDDVTKMGADFVREFSKIITAGKVRV